jgi:hypothetical protein
MIIYIYIYNYIFICTYINVCVCVCVYIYVYVYLQHRVPTWYLDTRGMEPPHTVDQTSVVRPMRGWPLWNVGVGGQCLHRL